MFFTINTKEQNIELVQLKLFFLARRSIILHKLTPDDIIMSRYLEKKHGYSLKALSLQILNAATIQHEPETGLIVTFKNNKFDKLASLITYGNGIINGSHILTNAFLRR